MFIKAKMALKRGYSLQDKYKLFMLAAYTSRPKLRPILKPVYSSFLSNGEIKLRLSIREKGPVVNIILRDEHFFSDYLSMTEVIIDNCYLLPIRITPDLIVDGGSNSGLFSVLCNIIYPGKTIHAFEPMPDNYNRLRRNIEANGCTNVPSIPGYERSPSAFHATS